MKKLVLRAAAAFAAAGMMASANAAVVNVKEIRITNAVPTWLQVSEVVALSNGADVALAATAFASDDGTGTFGTTDTPDNAIDGIGPAAYPDIYHADTVSSSEFLLITFDNVVDLDALSIFGRTGTFSFRDVYDVELFDIDGNVIFSALGVSAANPDNEAIVFNMGADPVPVPAAALLFGPVIAGVALRRRKARA